MAHSRATAHHTNSDVAGPLHTDRTLQRNLRSRMARSTAGVYGFAVYVAGRGRVASLHPRRVLRPASTQKLFTTLPILLDQPSRRLVTSVTAATGPDGSGLVEGDLVVHATGDPSLLPGDLKRLAAAVRHNGVRRVSGRLVLDIGRLPTRTRQVGWKRDFVPDEVGPLSPLPVYEDVWRHDSGYLRNPTAGNLALLRKDLHDRGVRIAHGSVVVRSVRHSTVVLAQHSSAPLAAMVTHTLVVSDNFFAEQLLAVGGGHARVRALRRAAGVADGHATDGSGLSYRDRESALGELRLLRYAATGPAAALLHGALPVACRDGTLVHRLCGTLGSGTVFAKTGTLSHTTALAGYTTDANGHAVTFAVICGRVRNLNAAMAATDRVVLALRHYRG